MVYPGEESVNVVLDPGNIACLNDIDNDMSCTATIKEDGVYRVIIIRANEVGETVNDGFTFQCEFILLVCIVVMTSQCSILHKLCLWTAYTL